MVKAAKFFGNEIGLGDPSDDFRELAKGEPFDKPKYIYVGTAGTLIMKNSDGDMVPHVAAVGYMWARPTEIDETSTADDIVGYY